VQPDDSFHGLEGLKHIPTAIVPKIWDPSLADEIWDCPTEPAYDLSPRRGPIRGPTGRPSSARRSGGEAAGREIGEASWWTVFPDSGDSHLSTGLYGRK